MECRVQGSGVDNGDFRGQQNVSRVNSLRVSKTELRDHWYVMQSAGSGVCNV